MSREAYADKKPEKCFSSDHRLSGEPRKAIIPAQAVFYQCPGRNDLSKDILQQASWSISSKKDDNFPCFPVKGFGPCLAKREVMIKSILLLPFHFNGTECLGIRCSLDRELEKEIRRLKGVKWSGQHRCWFLPLTKESYQRIKDHLHGKVVFDITRLKAYLEQKKAITPLVKNNQISKRRVVQIIKNPLSEENLAAFKKYEESLVLKGYSPRTIKTYCHEFYRLLRELGPHPVTELSKQQVQAYLLFLFKEKGCSEIHLHTTVNALKFYFEKVENR